MSAARSALSAAMAMRRPVASLRPVKLLTPRRKMISAGTRRVEMRKARPRICSRYSRRATRSMLRIGLASHGLDKDFLERRLDEFETIDSGHGSGEVKKLLRVAAGLERYFSVAGVIIGRGDLIGFEEIGAAFE